MKLLNRLQEVLVRAETDTARAIHVTTRSGAGARIELPAVATGDMGTSDQEVVNNSGEEGDVQAEPTIDDMPSAETRPITHPMMTRVWTVQISRSATRCVETRQVQNPVGDTVDG
jgi:hypothetical protein